MVQVVDLGGDVRIFRGNALGRRHQFRTHGAGQRDQDLQIRLFLDRLDRGPALFVQSLSRPGGVVEAQNEGGELMAAGDAVEGKETNTMELQRRDYAECFSFMGYAPIIFISAQTGYNVNKLMQLIRDVDSQNGARVPTGVLNEMLARATARMQPPSDKGRRLKIFYLTQASTRPPTFVAFVNSKQLFHFSYQRYLINQIRENFGLEHTPIRLVIRERGSGEVGAKDV